MCRILATARSALHPKLAHIRDSGNYPSEMWAFASERRLGGAVWTAVTVLAAAALGFYWLQNHYRPVGGEISWPKLFWLSYAILLWFVLPILVAADPRLAPQWRRPFFFLFVLMLARGLAEL